MLTNEEPKKRAEAYTKADWDKLRILAEKVTIYAEKANERSEAVQREITNNKAFDEQKALIQNKQIRIRIYKRQIQEAKERIQCASNRLILIERDIEEHQNTEKELANSVSTSANERDTALATIEPENLTFTKLKNELIYRRRFMLFELYAIYFSNKAPKIRKEDQGCHCTRFDVIRGLHLPSSADRHGHCDIEMTAALGHLTNLLIMIGRILDYDYLSPLFFKSSKSFILERNTHQIFNLFDSTSRSHKERFVHAYLLLNRNIVQLRQDLGLSTLDLDRPIQNLQDAMLCAIGKPSSPTIQVRRCLNLHSLSLMIPEAESTSLGSSSLVTNDSKEDERENSHKGVIKIGILEVPTTTKNEPLELKKYCSRSVT